MRILIAEDERRLAGAIARGLRREGMAVDVAHDGASALVKARVVPYDVVVLDRDLPEVHGDDVCRHLSTGDERETKVLMLTAADGVEDLVEGLTIGADDYVGKPFEPRELSLRVASILRRARPASAPAVESVCFGEFRFHLARGELKRGDEIVRLTDRERDMLRLLAATPGETVPRQTLGGNDGATGERAVDVQVNRLRRKIEHDPANPLLVQTVRGIGYRLVTTP